MDTMSIRIIPGRVPQCMKANCCYLNNFVQKSLLMSFTNFIRYELTEKNEFTTKGDVLSSQGIKSLLAL